MTDDRIKTEEQMIALNRMLDALDNVPADRREAAIKAAAEFMQKIPELRAAGTSPEEIKAEIKAAGERIRAEYKSDIES